MKKIFLILAICISSFMMGQRRTVAHFNGSEKELTIFVAERFKVDNTKFKPFDNDYDYQLVRAYFDVEIDGTLTNFDVSQGMNEKDGTAEELVRVLKLSPKWIPSEENGVKVKSRTGYKIQLR